MRLQKISLGCAVADTTYYYEFIKPHKQYEAGVYYNNSRFPKRDVAMLSDRVWAQGPKGGVRIVHQNWWKPSVRMKYYGSNYLTKNQEAMKEFMWVKLKAKPIE